MQNGGGIWWYAERRWYVVVCSTCKHATRSASKIVGQVAGALRGGFGVVISKRDDAQLDTENGWRKSVQSLTERLPVGQGEETSIQ